LKRTLARVAFVAIVSLASVAGARPACLRLRPGGIRTLAWVETSCHADTQGTLTGRTALRIRRGDCPPVTVLEFAVPPAPDPLRVCRFFGVNRVGHDSVIAGAFQRLAVSPDGSVVVFEVNNAFDVVQGVPLTDDQKGFFRVRADGRELRRLAPPSRDAAFRLGTAEGLLEVFVTGTTFSPDGRSLVYTDRGPGPDGVDATQVVTLDVVTGRYTQVTRLPRAAAIQRGFPETGVPRFIDDQTIVFVTYSNPDGAHPGLTAFTVRADGTGLRALPVPLPAGGSAVVPRFSVSGAGSKVLTLLVPGDAVNQPGLSVYEVFFLDGRNLLQLTNYQRFDTEGQFLGRGGQAFITASADPLGLNPTGDCQIFSIDRLGGHARQLTRFREGAPSVLGCSSARPPPAGCVVKDVVQDPVTGTLVFYSTCNALGTTPYGAQLYAMRPDGSALRQLTDTAGYVVAPDGAISVELPGPAAYSAPARF
jgi:hypothetical protein